MAKIRILIDTDIIIDSLKGIRAAKELFRTEGVDLYCSILTKKELLSKGGLKDSSPLLTRNRKHFEHIKEIKLSPGYEID
jgi:predicted nucleic acid-binding protein